MDGVMHGIAKIRYVVEVYVWVLKPTAFHSFTNRWRDASEEDFNLMDWLICASAALHSGSYGACEVEGALVGDFRQDVYRIDSL